MSRSTSESDEAVLAKDQAESPLPEESNCGGNSNGGLVLKKGPWTAAEDAILIEYVKKHGEGNWNAVQKHSGLFRCGKSCRLRWANHLRPNLKKGAFTQEEEHLIIELHAKIGNKWARMAAHLPGRTDNEIKNYWNTRIKRRQRAGLPLYPPEVSFQAMRKSQQGLTIGGIDSGDKVHHDFLQHTNSYEIPDLVFDSLKANHGISPYIPELPDITSSSLMMKGLGSSQYSSFITPTMHRQKRLRESTTLLSGYSGSMKNEYLLLDQFQNDTSDKVAPSFGLSFTLDSGPVVAKTPESIVENEGSHTFSNCNFSASRSTSGAVKLELPSLQYPDTELVSWGTSSPPPLLDPVDTFILSPPTAGVESNCPSPRNSGLLDALLHEAKALSNAKNNSSDKSSNSSTVTPCDIADTSTLNICEAEWEDYGEPLSPLGHTATSLFSECTPVSASGSSLDEQPPAETIAGCDAKLEQPELVWAPEREKETTEQLNVTRPDALLAADWLEHSSSYVKDQGTMTDAIASLLGDDLSNDYRLMAAEPSAPAHEWGLGSCAWNNMPAVCQMSELP